MVFLPCLNTQLVLRSTAWGKFNGGSDNDDGAGRDASANNPLYLLGWIAFQEPAISSIVAACSARLGTGTVPGSASD